jgi:glycosyltransferase involved in cell wall biosynthesis
VRIALLTWDWPSFAGGGVAALSHTLAAGLAAVGATVEVWTRGGGARTATLAGSGPDGVPVVGIRGRSWRRRGQEHLARRLPAELRRFRPDALLVSPWDGLPGARRACAAAGVKPTLLVFAHGRDVTGEPGDDRVQARAEAFVDPAVRWLCLTEWLRDELGRRGASATVVPAAVPAPGAMPPGEPGRWLALGRLIPRKGHDVLLAALRLLVDEGHPARLEVVGDGPQRAAIEALATGLPVTVHGAVTDARREELWARCSALVLPCRDEVDGEREGYGLVYTEAGARGRPVIAGRAGGVPGAVDHERTGLLVDPADPAAVAAALLRLDTPEAQAWGRAGRIRWEQRHQPRHLAAAVLDAAR